MGEGATNHCGAIAFLLEVLDEPEFVVSLLRLRIEERTAIGCDTRCTATDLAILASVRVCPVRRL